MLGFLASFAYYFWWMWQYFLFARRERFPRARAFWWTLVPLYGWVVIYRAFDDLDEAAGQMNRVRYRAGSTIVLLAVAFALADVSNRTAGVISLVTILVSFAATAAALFQVQRSANDYIAARHPDAKPTGVTWGEITASVIGIVLLALIILGETSPS